MAWSGLAADYFSIGRRSRAVVAPPRAMVNTRAEVPNEDDAACVVSGARVAKTWYFFDVDGTRSWLASYSDADLFF